MRVAVFWLQAFLAASVTAHENNLTHDLIAWIRSLEGGIYDSRQGTNDEQRGIVATEDIAKGDILLQVPWKVILGSEPLPPISRPERSLTRHKLIPDHDDEDNEEEKRALQESICRLTDSLYAEVQLGEASDVSVYLKYLGLLDPKDESFPPRIPAAWSEEGRALLEDMNENLPPEGLFTPLNIDRFGHCIADIEDPLQRKIAATVSAHSGSGKLFHEHALMVPLLDNYHYIQKPSSLEYLTEDKAHSNLSNTFVLTLPNDSVRLVATKDIDKGEPIVRAFHNFESEHVPTAPGIFRDFGIVDSDVYPKYFVFDLEDDLTLSVLVEKHPQTDKYLVTLLEDDEEEEDEPDSNQLAQYMTQIVHKLERLKALWGGPQPPPNSKIPQHEWEAAWTYHDNLLEVARLTHDLLVVETKCPGGYPQQHGTCPVWDGMPHLFLDEITDLNLEFDPSNPNGPTEQLYDFCNDEYVIEWFGYEILGEQEVIESQYQDIKFIRHPETKDTVMKLDGTVQQSSGYRPHYHEFAVHFPARFLDSVENVLFVGGGDSMVLHEVLKYPTLQRVVGLELDQYVLRNSFRYFHTQPHFDDKRVEWWFGDGAKSLLMLPKEYFQSFDLVVVDLSETVMSFQVTEKLSIFQTLSLLLKPEGIMLKNGEYYMDKMSRYFDYTLQYFEYNVPFICDQGMVIGSNRIDFFNRTMKDHGVDLLVLESQETILEEFHEYYRFTEYRKNDARVQQQCATIEEDSADDGTGNAGILLVVEIENATYDPDESVKDMLQNVLTDAGVSFKATVTNQKDTFVGVFNEGYVTLRLVPEKSYIGLDIHFWGKFELMEKVKSAFVKAVNAQEDSTSSFRIVTGGMHGTPSQQTDRTKIGPRIIQSRNCEPMEASTPKPEEKSIDLVQSAMEASLFLAGEPNISIVVLCGRKGQPCPAFESLVANDSSQTVIPVYTCDKLHGAEFSMEISALMTECEMEVSNLFSNVEGKISVLMIDNGSEPIMGKIILSIASKVWTRKRFFSNERFLAMANSNGIEDSWRRNLLIQIREKVLYKPMSMVDVLLSQNDIPRARWTILSLHDTEFFLHLKELVTRYNAQYERKAGAKMTVEKVFDGLIHPTVGQYQPKWFHADDYDPTPAKEQLAKQVSLGRQSVIQFKLTKDRVISKSLFRKAVMRAIERNEEDLELSAFQSDSFGDGLVGACVSKDGTISVVLIWDGKKHITVNLFSQDESPRHRQSFIDSLQHTLQSVELVLSDTHPRGVGRVVSFPGDMN